MVGGGWWVMGDGAYLNDGIGAGHHGDEQVEQDGHVQHQVRGEHEQSPEAGVRVDAVQVEAVDADLAEARPEQRLYRFEQTARPSPIRIRANHLRPAGPAPTRTRLRAAYRPAQHPPTRRPAPPAEARLASAAGCPGPTVASFFFRFFFCPSLSFFLSPRPGHPGRRFRYALLITRYSAQIGKCQIEWLWRVHGVAPAYAERIPIAAARQNR